MAVFRVELSRSAARAIRDLERKMQVRILSRLQTLAVNPRPVGVKKLQGEDHVYRIREGDYRIVYEVFDKKLLIHVLRMGHRREIYR